MDVVKSILEGEREKVDPRKCIEVHKDIDLDIDEGSLLASDYNTFNMKTFRSNPDEYLQNITRDNVQLLVNKIWELPTQRIEEAIIAKLPKPQYVLPRSRHIPKPKPLTKWQQFAKEKGIKAKKNKSKLKWDEELKKWIPMFGYKRAQAEQQKEWLVEVGDNNKPVDTFAAAKSAKDERKAKNELQRLRNIAKAKNIKLPRVGLPTKEHFPNAKQLSQAVTVARVSTASVGKFQDRLSKEKDAKGLAKEVPGMKRKAQVIPRNIKEEKHQTIRLADSIFRNKKTILTDDSGAPTAKKRKSSVTKKNKHSRKTIKGSRKPKAGKGEKNMRQKVGGRKRR